MDGACRLGAEMASQIKARECRDHALVVSVRMRLHRCGIETRYGQAGGIFNRCDISVWRPKPSPNLDSSSPTLKYNSAAHPLTSPLKTSPKTVWFLGVGDWQTALSPRLALRSGLRP